MKEWLVQGRITQTVEVIVEAKNAEGAFQAAEKGSWKGTLVKETVDWEFDEDDIEENA